MSFEPGRELLYPVATVIVGGLVSTTLLDLLLTPGIFWIYGRHAALHANHERLATDARSEDIAASLEPDPSTENPS